MSLEVPGHYRIDRRFDLRSQGGEWATDHAATDHPGTDHGASDRRSRSK
jgi:hypothetical protein